MTWDADLEDGAHTIGRWIVDRALQSPQRIAIDDRGVTVDYATLAGARRHLAEGLRQSGYGPGDRIATVSGNSSDHVVAFFACALAGVAFVPLSWRLTPRELVDVLERSAPALVLVEDEHAALAGEALRGLDVAPPVAALGTTGVEASVPPLSRSPRAARHVHDDDPLLVIFTSGSEAAPKGVVLTHANCFWNNLALSQALPLTQDDVVLAMLPQFHVAGWNCQPLLAWWVGATVVLERSFQPARALQLIADRRVTAMMGVPTQYAMLAADRDWEATDTSSLRLALVGGATVPASCSRPGRNTGCRSPRAMASPRRRRTSFICRQPRPREHPGAVGRPYPHVSVRIVDPASGLALDGEATGELWVRGPSVFAGYLGDERATADAMRGEWLRTGDLVHRDADGVFRSSTGSRTSTSRAARTWRPPRSSTPWRCIRSSMRPPSWGFPTRSGASAAWRSSFPSPGAALSADEVLAHARRNLAAFKVPVRVEFVDALPRSTIEKLARARLRDRARELMEGVDHESLR